MACESEPEEGEAGNGISLLVAASDGQEPDGASP